MSDKSITSKTSSNKKVSKPTVSRDTNKQAIEVAPQSEQPNKASVKLEPVAKID